MIYEDVTLGVSCSGNIKALLMNLTSVLTSGTIPSKIQLRLEGAISGFAEFYLEQIADLARYLGVEFSIHIFRSTGVRDSRDWQIKNCSTPYLWILDDDVIVHPLCLDEFRAAIFRHLQGVPTFFAGSKMDVSNRRGYPHFSMQEEGLADFKRKTHHNHNLPYKVEELGGVDFSAKSFDAGNVVFTVKNIRQNKLTFRLHPDQANPSGDGTTFALALAKAGLIGFFVPAAKTYHLEKPSGGFNEFEARREMLLRTADLHGFDKQIIQDYFMPKF